MTQEELNKIIENHQHWLNQDCDGWETMRANLSGCDLRKNNLQGVNLAECNLAGAYLARCNLAGAYLAGCNLTGAYLAGCNLAECNLAGAYLAECNLAGAYLVGCNLAECNLAGAYNIPFIPMACPDTGSFIGWKKANGYIKNVIVKLLIPEDAKRSSATGRKCRCDKAKVLSITSLYGKVQYQEAYSQFDRSFVYKVGKEVAVPDFCENRFKECAAGIHFFINREEAVRY